MDREAKEKELDKLIQNMFAIGQINGMTETLERLGVATERDKLAHTNSMIYKADYKGKFYDLFFDEPEKKDEKNATEGK